MGGSVYALAGGKGGVGKTTVTANLAVALHEAGHEVAVVDADLGMTNLGQLFGLDPEQGVHRVLAGDAELEAVTIQPHDGFTVVPGEDGIGATGDADPANLRDVIEPLRTSHDIVLLDTGAGLNHQNCVAYGRADAVVLVATPTRMSVANLEKTREMVDHVDGTVAGLVLTRDRDHPDCPTPRAVVGELETDLLGLIPEYEVPNASEPRVVHAPESPAATGYERLATTMTVYHQTGDTSEATADIDPTTLREQFEQSEQADDEQPAEDADEADESTDEGLVGRLSSALNSQ